MRSSYKRCRQGRLKLKPIVANSAVTFFTKAPRYCVQAYKYSLWVGVLPVEAMLLLNGCCHDIPSKLHRPSQLHKNQIVLGYRLFQFKMFSSVFLQNIGVCEGHPNLIVPASSLRGWIRKIARLATSTSLKTACLQGLTQSTFYSSKKEEKRKKHLFLNKRLFILNQMYFNQRTAVISYQYTDTQFQSWWSEQLFRGVQPVVVQTHVASRQRSFSPKLVQAGSGIPGKEGIWNLLREKEGHKEYAV